MTAQLPVIAAKLPPLTPIAGSTRQQSEIVAHRAQILSAVEVVLDGYWRDDKPAALRADVLADWCDELENWPVESVRAALRKHRRDNPSRKPNPGHIVAILKESWGKRNADQVRAAMAPAPEPPKERISDERRRAILAEAGMAGSEPSDLDEDGRMRRMASAADAAASVIDPTTQREVPE